MKMILAIIGGSIGLIVTASAVFLAWATYQHLKSKANQEGTGDSPEKETAHLSAVSAAMLRWTFFDYALIAVFVIGSLFLLTDVIAVIRDSESYPLYHYGYLLCGFIFTLLGMLFMVLRLAAVLALVRPGRTAALQNNHHQPGRADHPE